MSPAAVAAGNFGRRLIRARVLKRPTAAGIAAAFEKLSVHVDYFSGTCTFVQVIDILSAYEQTITKSLFEFGEGHVRGIRLGCCGHSSAHGIELPHELRIALPGVRRSYFLDTVVPPQTINSAESGNAAFGADAGAGQNEE